MEENKIHNMPKISVIVPVYNAEKTLLRCVNSILNQTHQNIECILINDGSTDNSANLCDELKKKDTRIIALHQKNLGVSEARNHGLRNASGEWIGFVDSDDQIDKDMYSKLFANAINNSVFISICGFSIVENNEIIQLTNKKTIKKISSKKAIKLIKTKKHVEGGPWNKLFHNTVVKNIFFKTNINFGEDTLFLLETFCKVKNVVISTIPYYTYYIYKTSLSHRKEINIVNYAYLMLDTYNKNDAFLTKYAKATICYVEYLYAMTNEIKYIRNSKYLPYLLFSGCFALSTKISILLYWISPNIYFRLKKII